MNDSQPPPPPEVFRCFRHQFQKTVFRCELCRAKLEARGDFERARKIFVLKKKFE
jgi:hypothetical protein